MTARALLPLFLDLANREVLVVGAGNVATRKAEELVAMRAKVRVVAPEASDRVRALSDEGTLAWEARAFLDADLEGAWLVVASTDDPALQAHIASVCESRRLFCVAVDDPPNASAYGAAVVRRDPVTIAISTRGEAPALARLLREMLEQILPDEGYVEAARALREKWKREGTPMASRFGELVKTFKER